MSGNEFEKADNHIPLWAGLRYFRKKYLLGLAVADKEVFLNWYLRENHSMRRMIHGINAKTAQIPVPVPGSEIKQKQKAI